MASSITQRWLDGWGYANARQALHCPGDSIPPNHAYRNEISELLDPDNTIKATAVFDVEGVPTVCFIEDNGALAESQDALDRIREKIWNQNLISVLLLVSPSQATLVPVSRKDLKPETIAWADRGTDGPYSCRGVQAGELFRRHKDWFVPEDRVDQHLLRNLNYMIRSLEGSGLLKVDAQFLMAQVLFISYLEHRGIVGDRYRQKHNLSSLEYLVAARDRKGIYRLINRLKGDFNGELLEPETEGTGLWKTLSDEALALLHRFLCRDDLEGGQQSLWHYDFRYIPVELLSGIYESFLADDKRDAGAYYTPRHLANLAVDLAFQKSTNILSERIYDGACGSGILLTTAYRRMLSYAQARGKDRSLSFEERRDLLEGHIFGSDLNESACRVTAFSLYLSLLEGLQPSDISRLQDDNQVKLPNLSKRNIIGGAARGDFFSEKNGHLTGTKFSIILSNPPWVEPKGKASVTSDAWAKKSGFKIPRRQMAAAFMLRARDYLQPQGRACLILPVSVVAAPTSSEFLRTWLDHYELETLINFGDIRKLLFSTAKQPCLIAVGTARPQDMIGCVAGNETFEYWVPKADISLAFNRLSLHSHDRHLLATRFLQLRNESLTTLFWGTMQDMATISSLRAQGQLGDLIGSNGPWSNRKGFHAHDASISDPVSSKPLRKMLFLDARNLHVDGPLLDRSALEPFPPLMKTVTRLPKSLLQAFAGPKIIFTDGITSDRKIRAVFSKEAFSFKHSVGMLSGPEEDEPVMRFVAAYMQSSLAQYVLLMTAYQVNFERERVSLKDIEGLPFVHPDQHANPEMAWKIIKDLSTQMQALEKGREILRHGMDTKIIDDLVFDYFSLSRLQRSRIREVSEYIAPNLQPGSIDRLDTPLQGRAPQVQIEKYTRALREEIQNWSKARGGRGTINVSVIINTQDISGALGVVKIQPASREASSGGALQLNKDDRTLSALLSKLSANKLLPMDLGDNLQFIPETIVRSGDALYLVKPLIRRLWMSSEAYRDAERVVRSVIAASGDMEAAQ